MSKQFVSIPSDEEIVAMYWARDEEAIRQTDIKYRRFLISVALNILGNTQDSEECLNDTYMGAWNSIPPNRPSVLRAFLSAITRKLAISKYRTSHRQKRGLGQTFSLSDFEDFISDDQSSYTGEQVRALGQIMSEYIQGLTKRQRYIFLSRYYYAKTIDQITAELGCSKSTVNKEIAHIKHDLRVYLAQEGYTV